MIPELELCKNRSLKDLCTLGIGGRAEYYLEVKTINDLQEAIKMCHDKSLRFFILGKGSNTLFDDRGLQGVVIHNKIDFCEEKSDGVFYVGAGYSFSLLGTQTARQEWCGLEFACGIPGSVGGAIFMNAGANNQNTSETLKKVYFVNQEGTLLDLDREDLSFSYRHSPFQTMKGAIAAAEFALTPSLEARPKQLEILSYRKKTQPYGEKSAGCLFRNPESISAGLLIDQCGLKGLEIGKIKISQIHANFMINSGGGTSSEAYELIRKVKTTVKSQTGIELESEVQFIPYE